MQLLCFIVIIVHYELNKTILSIFYEGMIHESKVHKVESVTERTGYHSRVTERKIIGGWEFQ